MKKRIALYTLIAALTLAAASPLAAQGIGRREVFGIRLGAAYSPATLRDTFGGGSVIELHFVHGLAPWCGIAVALTSNDFGASNNAQKNIDFTGGLDREIDLEIYGVTAGFLALTSFHKNFLPTIEAGPGLYSINAVLPQGFFNAQKTEFRVGMYGGLGAIYKITGGFSVNACAKYHYIFSGGHNENTIFFFTGHNRTQMFSFTVGVLLAAG
jgi:hypothetical protein